MGTCECVLGILESTNLCREILIPSDKCWERGLKIPYHTWLKKVVCVLGKSEISLCVLGKSCVCWETLNVQFEHHTNWVKCLWLLITGTKTTSVYDYNRCFFFSNETWTPVEIPHAEMCQKRFKCVQLVLACARSCSNLLNFNFDGMTSVFVVQISLEIHRLHKVPKFRRLSWLFLQSLVRTSASSTVRTVGVSNPPCFPLPPSHFLPSPSASSGPRITILWIRHISINTSPPMRFESSPANTMVCDLLLIPMRLSAR
jgi:hypothetical protein